MRAFAVILLVALCGCPVGADRQSLEASDDSGGGGGSGNGSGAPGGGLAAECWVADDCVAAGPKCCDCPTHALPAIDPSAQACFDVDCAPASCGSPMQADCKGGQCVLECAPVTCELETCANGFATDANGCLTCECAVVAMDENACGVDGDCVRAREDCCGCANGGMDTALLAGEAAAYDAALACPANPSCPGVDQCAMDLAPRCVQGRCELVAGSLPTNACGRADLPACPTGEACTVNASDPATMQGVGVCQP